MREVVVMKGITGAAACRTCDGCGYLADDDDKTPFKFWLEMPVQSALALQMGLVKPVECPDCDGEGRLP